MKKLLIIIFFTFLILTAAHAEIKDYIYDGKEIYVHVKRDHVTTIIFPEPIIRVVRGFGADTYVIQRDDKDLKTLELMPTDSEVAEMTLSGISGEDYVLRFVANSDFYTKFNIHRLATSLDKKEEKTIAMNMDVKPEAVIEKKEQTINNPAHDIQGQVSNLPPELNLKITLKGNDLPLKIYLSTISQVTGYNVITTPDIDSQKTSINLENIEIWRALKSLLYKYGYGFKITQDDLIITETETKIFNITLPAVDQSFTDETSNDSFADNTSNNNNASSTNQQNQQVKVGTKIYYENTSPKLSLWTDLENNVKSMITPQIGSYSLNKVSGSIIVTDKPAVLDKIGDLVSTINESLSRQQGF